VDRGRDHGQRPTYAVGTRFMTINDNEDSCGSSFSVDTSMIHCSVWPAGKPLPPPPCLPYLSPCPTGPLSPCHSRPRYHTHPLVPTPTHSSCFVAPIAPPPSCQTFHPTDDAGADSLMLIIFKDFMTLFCMEAIFSEVLTEWRTLYAKAMR
jgi:hypothetical protein